MSIQSIIEQRVSRKNICSSFLKSDIWFTLPVLTGPNVNIYISSPKGLKSVALHIRWNSGKHQVGGTAYIQWNESQCLESNNAVGPVTSKKTGSQVTRFLIKAPVDIFQDLLSSKSILFSTGSYSEHLQVLEDKLSVIYFIASCYNYELLTESSKSAIDSEIGWEVRMKDAERKRKDEEEQKRILQNQKRLETREKVKEQIVDPKIMEANKQACLKEYSVKFVNLLLNVLNNPSDSRFIDLNHGHNPRYYLLHHIDVEKAYQLIANDKELKTKHKGISVSFKMLIAFLEKKEVINIVKNEDDRHPRYRLLRINEQQTLDMIDGKVKKDEVLGEKHSDNYNSSKKSSGCYIATCVYGSYDCPEVWTLRRYRDQVLRNTWLGRAFIKAYYATSPTLVKWFGDKEPFRAFNRKILDRWVRNLNEKGFDNYPYEDQ